MTTTFPNPELTRDELVALFVAIDEWQEVHGYAPSPSDVAGKHPVLFIFNRGVQQQMAGVDNNPNSIRFLALLWTLQSDDNASYTRADAADKADFLNMTFRQVLRDNAGSLTNGDIIRFGSGYSSVAEDVIIEGLPYRVEEIEFFVDFANGN